MIDLISRIIIEIIYWLSFSTGGQTFLSTIACEQCTTFWLSQDLESQILSSISLRIETLVFGPQELSLALKPY